MFEIERRPFNSLHFHSNSFFENEWVDEMKKELTGTAAPRRNQTIKLHQFHWWLVWFDWWWLSERSGGIGAVGAALLFGGLWPLPAAGAPPKKSRSKPNHQWMKWNQRERSEFIDGIHEMLMKWMKSINERNLSLFDERNGGAVRCPKRAGMESN